MNVRSYLLPVLLLTLLVSLTACGSSQGTQNSQGSQETEQGKEATAQEESQKEEAPPPPESAESPPLEEEPAGEVVEIGNGPEGVVADPQTGLVAVGVRDPAAVLLLDGASGKSVAEAELPAPTRHINLAAPGGPVLATAERTDELFQIGMPEGGVQSSNPVQNFPHNAAAYRDRIFVINEFGSTMSVIEDGEVVETLDTPLWPGGIAATESGLVAVLGVRGLIMQTYDARTLNPSGRAEAGEGPTHVVAGQGDRLYVTDTRGDAVLAYETDPELEQISRTPLPGGSPYGIALDPEREELWVTLTAENTLVRFSLQGGEPQEMARYPTVRQPNSVAVDPDRGRVYVTGRVEGELQILDPEA